MNSNTTSSNSNKMGKILLSYSQQWHNNLSNYNENDDIATISTSSLLLALHLAIVLQWQNAITLKKKTQIRKGTIINKEENPVATVFFPYRLLIPSRYIMISREIPADVYKGFDSLCYWFFLYHDKHIVYKGFDSWFFFLHGVFMSRLMDRTLLPPP